MKYVFYFTDVKYNNTLKYELFHGGVVLLQKYIFICRYLISTPSAGVLLILENSEQKIKIYVFKISIMKRNTNTTL